MPILRPYISLVPEICISSHHAIEGQLFDNFFVKLLLRDGNSAFILQRYLHSNKEEKLLRRRNTTLIVAPSVKGRIWVQSPCEAALRLFCINHVHLEAHLKPCEEKATREGDVSAVYFSNVFSFFFFYIWFLFWHCFLAVLSRRTRTFSQKPPGPTFSTMTFGGPC